MVGVILEEDSYWINFLYNKDSLRRILYSCYAKEILFNINIDKIIYININYEKEENFTNYMNISARIGNYV